MTASPVRSGQDRREEDRRRDARFVRYIIDVCCDTGTRAALRRGLGQPVERAYTMHPVVAPFLTSPEEAGAGYTPTERAYYTVAALIAAAPRQTTNSDADDDADDGKDTEDTETTEAPDSGVVSPARSLGVAMAEAVNDTSGHRRAMSLDNAEKRLHLLVRQSHIGVHRQLPGVVRRIQQYDVVIDWVQLVGDLRRWPYDQDRIAKRWLQDFYRTVKPVTGD
jgi:CRISPR system Cascade subunit CasB